MSLWSLSSYYVATFNVLLPWYPPMANLGANIQPIQIILIIVTVFQNDTIDHQLWFLNIQSDILPGGSLGKHRSAGTQLTPAHTKPYAGLSLLIMLTLVFIIIAVMITNCLVVHQTSCSDWPRRQRDPDGAGVQELGQRQGGAFEIRVCQLAGSEHEYH